VDSAVISWTANVIGLGRVDYGTSSPDELAATDQLNIADHSMALSGLLPDMTYQFRVSNRHAIDGGSLAETVGSFTTLPSAPPGVRLTRPSARPRVIYPEDVATLSVVVRNDGAPMPNVLVRFRAESFICCCSSLVTVRDDRKPQSQRTDSYLSPVGQPDGTADPPLLHERAVLASEVFNQGLLADRDPHMPPRDGRRWQFHDVGRTPAEDVLTGFEGDAFPLADQPGAHR
jgi:hypothetical protein